MYDGSRRRADLEVEVPEEVHPDQAIEILVAKREHTAKFGVARRTRSVHALVGGYTRGALVEGSTGDRDDEMVIVRAVL